MSERRWYVERARDQFEDVGAQAMTLEPCGALRFRINDDGEEIIYAPGSWITVYDEVEPTVATQPTDINQAAVSAADESEA